jgi:hypothetical protein
MRRKFACCVHVWIICRYLESKGCVGKLDGQVLSTGTSLFSEEAYFVKLPVVIELVFNVQHRFSVLNV